MHSLLFHSLGIACSTTLLVVAVPARGQEPRGAPHTGVALETPNPLAVDATRQRLDEIERALRAEAPPARRWHRGWPVVFGVLALGQGAAALLWEDKREMLAVGAVVSAAGGIGRLVIPFAPARASRRLERLPETTELQRAAKLRFAEGLLVRSAKAEAMGRTALPIAGAAVVSGVGATVLWLGYDEPEPALTMFSGGILIAEVVRETQPHSLPAARIRYETRWEIAAAPGGLWLNVTF